MARIKLADEMLMCRTVGHSWDSFIPMMRRPEFGERMSFLCVRCTTERHDIISWINGELLQREYRYPDGYHLTEKYTRNDFRKEFLVRRRRMARAS